MHARRLSWVVIVTTGTVRPGMACKSASKGQNAEALSLAKWKFRHEPVLG